MEKGEEHHRRMKEAEDADQDTISDFAESILRNAGVAISYEAERQLIFRPGRLVMIGGAEYIIDRAYLQECTITFRKVTNGEVTDRYLNMPFEHLPDDFFVPAR